MGPHTSRLGASALLVLAAGCGASRPSEESAALPACDPAAPFTFARSPGGAPEVDAEWLARHRCAVRIVDVREEGELEGPLGRIEGAEWAPLASLPGHAAAWPSDTALVVVDRSGRRASRAVEQLGTLGLRRAASLTGGMLAWHGAGFPVVRGALPEVPAPPSIPAPPTDPVRSHLGDPQHVVWVPLASIVGAGTEQCIDGRGEGPVVGTPGGDAGELLLALGALEHATHEPVRMEAVDRAVAAWVEGFGRFYLHTDRSALARLGAALAADERFAGRGELTPGAIEALVRRPPPELEAPLLDALVRPEHIGCGHLRTMLTHPSEYGVRAELVEAVLRASFRLGWARPELLDLAVLEGEHEETAVVRVHMDEPIHTYTRVPTFPAAEGASFFVAHPEVSAFLRVELGSFLEERAADLGLAEPEPTALEAALSALAERQVAATLRHLARELPVYDVHVHDGIPEVTGPNASLGCRDY